MNRNKLKICVIGAVITAITVMVLGMIFAPDSSLLVLGLIGAALGVVSALTLVNQLEKMESRIEDQVQSMTKYDRHYDADNREFFLTELNESLARQHAQTLNTAQLSREAVAGRLAVTIDGKVLGVVDQKFNDALFPVLETYHDDLTIRLHLTNEDGLHLGLSIRSKKTGAREALKKAFEACADL